MLSRNNFFLASFPVRVQYEEERVIHKGKYKGRRRDGWVGNLAMGSSAIGENTELALPERLMAAQTSS